MDTLLLIKLILNKPVKSASIGSQLREFMDGSSIHIFTRIRLSHTVTGYLEFKCEYMNIFDKMFDFLTGILNFLFSSFLIHDWF